MDLEERRRVLSAAFNLRWRWAAFALALVFGLVNYIYFHLGSGLLVALAGIAAAGASLVAIFAARVMAQVDDLSKLAAMPRWMRLLYLRVSIDLCLFVVAIYVSGGLESPVLLLLVSYLIVTALHTAPRVGNVFTWGTLAAIAIMAVLEFSGVLPHMPFDERFETNLYLNPVFDLFVFAFLAGALHLGVFHSRRITARLRSREAMLAQSATQLSQRVSELSAQREIGQQLAGSLQLDRVLDTIGLAALQLVQANNVHIFLYDESTGKFGLGVGVWADGQRRLAVSTPRENGLSRAVVRARRPILIDAVEHHPLYTSPESRSFNLQSIAGFPIRKGERVVGILNAAFATPHHFTDDERDALLALADQAALAIDNASLYTQIEQRARELSALYRVNLGISQSLEPKQLMQEALAAVQEVMEISFCRITLADEFAAAEQDRASGLPDRAATAWRIDPGYAKRVIASGEPLVVRDAAGNPSESRANPYGETIHALATVPLKAQDRVLGVLQIGRRDQIEFTPGDVSLISAIAQQIAIALENARLYSEARRRAEELASLREIGLATTSTLQLREQLRLLQAQVQQLLHPDTFFVGLYDQARQEINIQFVVEEGWELRGPIVALDAAGLSSWVVRMRRPLRVNDMEEERGRLPVVPRHELRPARSWLGVPLVTRDRVVGILSVQSFRPRAFTAADERFLVSVAQHAALTIENAHLYENAQRRTRELELIGEISRAITGSLHLPDIFQRTVRGLADTFGYQFVSIHLLKGNEFHLQAQVGFDQAAPIFPLQGVIGRVARTGQVAFVRDVQHDPDYVQVVPGVNSEIVVPIRREKRVVGVLDVEDRRSDALTEEDVRILSSFCEQLGIAVANAELYQSALERERLASSLHRVALSLTSTLDSVKILDTLCRESLEFFRAHGAHVWLVQGDEMAGIAACGEHHRQFLNLRVGLNQDTMMPVRAVRERRAIYLNDVQHHADRNPVLWELFKPQSLIGVPLIIENEVVGILVLTDSQNPQRFSAADVEPVTLFASQATIALANARLFARATTT
ncbi:MAG: GAF domain-containing protein [Chloroflexi bacterium]|nr:GAF domain-containing protein [Chloroflexota bacterium]